MTLYFVFLLPSGSAIAAPGISDCGASMTPVYPFDFTCSLDGSNPCSFDSGTGTLTCELQSFTCNDPTELYLVSTSSNKLAAYGKCDITGAPAEEFCCSIDDSGGEIDRVVLQGAAVSEAGMGFQDLTTTFLNLQSTHGGGMIAEAYGNDGQDTILGSNTTSLYAEYLYGGDNHDTISGKNGDDHLYGQAGNDDLFGGDGDDWLFGNTGDDDLFGGDDDDWLHGGYGADELFGENGSDVLYGARGNDELDGGSHDDVLCETTTPAGSTCATDSTMIGGSGSNDRAIVLEHGSCPASGHTLDGNDTVEEARDDDFNWNPVVFDNVNDVVPGGSPLVYSECTSIISVGGT